MIDLFRESGLEPVGVLIHGGDKASHEGESWRVPKSNQVGVLQLLLQAGEAIKYFIITDVGYSSPSTILKLYGGTDYDLTNSAIIEPYFSMAKAPYGFPLDEAKWRVESRGLHSSIMPPTKSRKN